MESLGINWGYLLVTIFNLILLLGWPLFAILTLLQLRRRDIPEVARAIWVALIIIVPYLGALAYWLVKPGERPQNRGARESPIR
ncbi:MAG: PLDc N-terminal domain-containing protein [Anaerolineales bacterium]|jgi:hypothetical protein